MGGDGAGSGCGQDDLEQVAVSQRLEQVRGSPPGLDPRQVAQDVKNDLGSRARAGTEFVGDELHLRINLVEVPSQGGAEVYGAAYPWTTLKAAISKPSSE